MTEDDLKAIEARLDAAKQMVSDLCNRRRDWIMSIPARPDYDPDLVISAALTEGTELLAEVRRLREDLAAIREAP